MLHIYLINYTEASYNFVEDIILIFWRLLLAVLANIEPDENDDFEMNA